MKALKIELEDANTGATASVHVVRAYTIDFDGGFSQARLAGFINERTLAAGKLPVSNRHVMIPAIPPVGQHPEEWLTAVLSVPASDAMRANPAYQASPYVGAEVITIG